MVSVEGERASDVLITCEHAGNRVPSGFEVPPGDRPWLETHWGYDLGAAHVARALGDELKTRVILAEFSRLLCDTNRPLNDETWIRRTVEDGVELSFNAGLTGEDKRNRRQLWDEYHRAVDATIRTAIAEGCRPTLLSVHTMTHLYVGHARDMELAVLYNDHVALAEGFARALESHGFRVARNEPYSGYEGLMYSVERHGKKHALPYVEIEVRQDLLGTASQAQGIARVIAAAIRSQIDDRREEDPVP